MSLVGNVYHLRFPIIPDDPKGHRYVVVRDEPDSEYVRVVYGTSEKEDERKKPYAEAVKWTIQPLAGNGLEKPTHFLPVQMYAVPRLQLIDRTARGSLGAEKAVFRSKFLDAIGYRTGPRHPKGGAAGSWRGAIVRLSPQIKAPIGIILTSHRYSMEEQYQLLLPLQFVPASEEPEDGTLTIGGLGRVARRFSVNAQTGVTRPSLILVVRHFMGDVREHTGVFASAADVEVIEDAVVNYMLPATSAAPAPPVDNGEGLAAAAPPQS